MPSITEQKQSLRDSLRAQIKLLTDQQKELESAIVRERVADYIKKHIPSGKVIASFAGLPSEPDLLDLHDSLPHYQFAYPKCGVNHTMNFYLVNDVDTDLVRGSYGIREPNEITQNEVAIEDISLFIVPAYGYTLAGKRLGKGGGYYDRALKLSAQNTPFLGAIFSIQILHDIPSERHDIPVDLVITTS